MAENNKNKNKVQIDPTYAHLQPQAVNVEQAVLGALMIDSDAFSVVSELLKPDTFYDPRHKSISGYPGDEHGGTACGYHDSCRSVSQDWRTG